MSVTAIDTTTRQPAAALAIRTGQQHWTDTQRAALDAIGVKNATQGDLDVFFHYCQKTGLDPFSRQIYMICRKEKISEYVNGRWEDKWVPRQTIQIGIDGFRIIRDRAAKREAVEVEYSETIWFDADGSEHRIWLNDYPPAGCFMVVKKAGKPYPAALTYAEYVQKNSNGHPTGRWREAPAHQLEKCAEAFALRRAFPHDLGGVHLEDEPVTAPQDTQPAAPKPRGRVTVEEVTRRPAAPPDEQAAEDIARQDAAGEPEPEQDTGPRPARPQLLGVIAQHFDRLGITERDERLTWTSKLARRDLTSSKELTDSEARDVAGLLWKCQNLGDLTALADDGEAPAGEGDD